MPLLRDSGFSSSSVRCLLGGFALACTLPLVACGNAEEGNPEADTATADELAASEEESFADLDASGSELARAKEGEAFDNELTMFALPAPRLIGLSWKSPGALARRTLINEGLSFSRAIGHAGLRVQCAATADRPAAHFQGSMTSTGDEFRTMVLKEKAGLGVLFRTVPGKVEPEDALQKSLDERYQNGRVSYLRMGISSETCHQLLDYAKEYEARGIGGQYGFVRPLHQEGAGCSAFTMSFLKLANLVEPRMNAWKFDVKVPMSVLGGETNPGNEVGVARLLLLTRGWAGANEANLRINGWDPTLMFKSVRLWAKSALKDGSEVVEKRGKALGIVLDRRDVQATPELLDGSFFRGTPDLQNDARFLTADE